MSVVVNIFCPSAYFLLENITPIKYNRCYEYWKDISPSEKDKHFKTEEEQIGGASDGAFHNGGCFI